MIGLAVDGDRAAVQLFPLRDGRLVDRFAFHLENVAGQDRATILESFCLEHYGAAPSRPAAGRRAAGHRGHRRARRPTSATSAARASWCARRSAARSAGSPSSPTRTRVWRSSTTRPPPSSGAGAASRRSSSCGSRSTSRACRSRIECFDVSNIQGREIVASMSVFVDGSRGAPTTGRSRVRGLEGQDDFAAMGQVVSRRFARLRDSASVDRFDESFAPIPNLVVIDGGKGQLSAALEAIHATYDLPRVAVVALAKRDEEVFVPGRSTPIRLDRSRRGLATSPACSG